MSAKQPEKDPMTVDVLSNEVAITGPDGLAVSLTGEAAAESGRGPNAAARLIAEGNGDQRNGTEDDAPQTPTDPTRD